jgi:hypothetical protein
MACPNFKNGQKNGLGPLGVKLFVYGNSFYLCLCCAKLCKLQLWCPIIWKSIWKFTWFVKNKGHQYWSTLCTLEQAQTSQQGSTPWYCTSVPPQPITIALGLKVHHWFKVTKVSKIWIAALTWETALGNTYNTVFMKTAHDMWKCHKWRFREYIRCQRRFHFCEGNLY